MKLAENPVVIRNCQTALANFATMLRVAEAIESSTQGQNHENNKNSDFLLQVSLHASAMFRAANAWFDLEIRSAGAVKVEGIGEHQIIILLPQDIDCLPTSAKSQFYFKEYRMTFTDGSTIELPFEC